MHHYYCFIILPCSICSVKYFKDDPELPIYAAPCFGYPLHQLIDILLKQNMPPEHVCTVQPLAVAENAAFVINVDSVNFGDLRADDLGLWKGTGTKRVYFRFSPSGTIKYAANKPSAQSDYFLLTRRYFVLKSYEMYHKMIADIRSKCSSIAHIIFGRRLVM